MKLRSFHSFPLSIIAANLLFWLAVPAHAVSTNELILQRLQALEQQQVMMAEELQAKDQRIRELESRLGMTDPTVLSEQTIPGAQGNTVAGVTPAAAAPAGPVQFGEFQPGGRGFKLAETPMGDVNFSAWAYARYLNQKALDDSYTDSFGRTKDIDQRNDFQLNKVNLYFKGWLFDPKFRYLLYTWTANTSQGDSAQVVVAGNMSYKFNEAVDTGVGIGALPGTRSLRGTFPYWTRVDARPMSDEFFRPSYTTGIWSSGELAEGLKYKLMLGNNLSQLGVNAAQLDSDLDTWSGTLYWMPTTGEFGPSQGYGDFENHAELATLFGISGTTSREDRQSQPGTDDIQNSQIRLSDGTIIFQPDAFDSGGRINNATYYMLSVDAAMKYRGFSLSGEYYNRWVNDFDVDGEVPVNDLYDHGFQLQTSYMFLPKTLQGYVTGSKLFGEYGDPWDASVGLNWFPLQQRLLRVNSEILYMRKSPVGYASVPAQVGGNGYVFQTNLEMLF